MFLLAPDRTIIYGPERYSRGTKLTESWAEPLLTFTGKSKESGHAGLGNTGSNSVFIYENLTAGSRTWTLVKRVPDSVLHGATRQVTQVNTIVLLAGC